MKNLALAVVAAASLISAPSIARADDEAEPRRPNTLGIGLYTGLRPDMAALGSSIVKDGVLELPDGNVLRAFGGTKYFVASDKDDDVLFYGSSSTQSQWQFLKARKSAGELTGLTLGLDVRYDMNETQHLPLFARLGFDFTFRVVGGDHSRTLGGAIDTATPFGPAIKELTGGTEGGTLRTKARASWFEIPLTVGLSIPVRGGHKVYAGVGVSYFNGGFSLEFTADEKYMKAATMVTDGARLYGPFITEGSSSKVQFDYAGFGPNFCVGAEARLADRSAVFVEFNGAGVAQTVYSNDLGEGGARLLTILNSSAAGGVVAPYGQDPQLLKRFAFPVVLGGGYFKLGYRFYVL